jgi:opacity protein-like surface antigen
MRYTILAASLLSSVCSLTTLAQKGIHRWTGFHIGVSTGAATGNYDFSEYNQSFSNATNIRGQNGVLVVVPGTTRKIPEAKTNNQTSFTAGLLAGYDKNVKQWLFGLEGDVNWLSLKGGQDYQSTLPATLITAGSNFEIHHAATTNWMESVRGRIGYLFSHSLIYGTAGVAFASIKATTNDVLAAQCCGSPTSSNPAPSNTVYSPISRMETSNQSASNATFGAGYEWWINSNVSVGLEYRHAKFNRDFNTGNAFGLPGSVTPNQPNGLSGGFNLSGREITLTTNVVVAKVDMNIEAFKKK